MVFGWYKGHLTLGSQAAPPVVGGWLPAKAAEQQTAIFNTGVIAVCAVGDISDTIDTI